MNDSMNRRLETDEQRIDRIRAIGWTWYYKYNPYGTQYRIYDERGNLVASGETMWRIWHLVGDIVENREKEKVARERLARWNAAARGKSERGG
jgi:hypothetical protein